MTQVDFYVLDDAGEPAALRAACRVVEKAWGQGYRVYVLARDEEQAARMDDTLWTYRQDSFVPHRRWRGEGDPDTPVLIGSDAATPPPGPQVLVNLGGPVPSWYARCERVAEIVDGDPDSRARSRDRYRHYRDAGEELRSHEVRA